MRLSILPYLLLPLLLPSHATPLALTPRQLLPTGQTVKQDVINIHNAVLALDATVRSFNGSPLPTSLIQGTPVLFGVAEIHRVNRAGYVHAVAAGGFSVEESGGIIDAVVGTVDISIPNATRNLKSKAPAFKQGGMTPVVVASLKLLLYDHDSFSAAVLAKADRRVGEEKVKEGEAAVGNIHGAIQDAIDFFGADLV